MTRVRRRLAVTRFRRLAPPAHVARMREVSEPLRMIRRMIGRMIQVGSRRLMRTARRGIAGWLEVHEVVGVHIRLTAEQAQVGEPVVARSRKRVIGLMRGKMPRTGDHREVVRGVIRIGLQPALNQLAGLMWRSYLPCGIALPRSGHVIQHDDRAIVHDA